MSPKLCDVIMFRLLKKILFLKYKTAMPVRERYPYYVKRSGGGERESSKIPRPIGHRGEES